MAPPTEDLLYMSVSSPFVVNLAREIFWFEDNPTKAIDILKCFKGISDTQIKAILNGNATIIDSPNPRYKFKVDHEFKTRIEKHRAWKRERDKDDIFINLMHPAAVRYIEANVWENGWAKAEAHFGLCMVLCSYLTGDEYKKEYGSLKLRIHEITRPVTNYLNESIGLPVPIGYVHEPFNESDIPLYATKLCLKLLEIVKKENRDELLKLIWS